MSEGYIKIARKAFRHPLFTNTDTKCRFTAWLDLLQLATWANGGVKRSRLTARGPKMVGEQELERGTVAISQAVMMSRWGWSKDRVRAFIVALESEGMIAVTKGTKVNVIKILNYDKYQGGVTEEKAPVVKEGEERIWDALEKIREGAYKRNGTKAGPLKQTPNRVKLIRQRIAEYGEETVFQAVRGAWFSEWHCATGPYEDQEMKLVPENILTVNSKINQVERLSEMGYNPPQPKRQRPEDNFRDLRVVQKELEQERKEMGR